MANTNSLRYGDKVNYYEGVIVEVRPNGTLAIDVKGRLGYFDIPSDLIIAESPLLVGQTVGWKMSFIEQLPIGTSGEYTRGVRNPDYSMYMEATVSDVDDCAVAMEIKENQGYFKAPMRMHISEVPYETGQLLGWNMTELVQLGPEVNDKYVSNIQTRERRAGEISNRNN